MPENPAAVERAERLETFVAYRKERLQGDEKGEAQVFLDRLFRALGHEGVYEAGATLEQRVRRRDQGGTAFADLVWKPRVLVEMKKGGEDLSKHYRQAFEYWIDLVPDRPQFVVLCNFDEFWVYDFNRQLDEPVDRIEIDDLPRRWEALGFLFPVLEEPSFGNDLVEVTRESAAKVSQVFNQMVQRGVARSTAQRFILQALMAMFSEDVGLLSRHSFTTAIEDSLDGGSAYDLVFGLFREMNAPGVTPGGRFAETPYFNGGLFRDVEAFELEREEVEALQESCQEDWSKVRPAIFGTLFEQSLEMAERHAYGAHFTSEADIQKVVLPTIVRPWRERIEAAGTIEELFQLERELLQYRVLDPACGCGNFLYVAYRELRRLEKDITDRVRGRRQRQRREAAEAELPMAFVSPRQFLGLDINAFAVEVAKVTLMLARKLAADELDDEQAVLPLDDLDENFRAEDAVFADWPEFDACIGNPPYLGRQKLTDERGAGYVARLEQEYPDVYGFADYVVYWFRKAHDLLPEGQRAGLVGTNTVRQGATREASLDYVVDNGGVIHDAVSSQPWSGDAQVHVSIVNWAKGLDVESRTLWLADGTTKVEVDEITGSLSPEVDLRAAENLEVNRDPKREFQGQTPGRAAFVLDPEAAKAMVERDPGSAEAIHPYLIGQELAGSGRPERFIIDNPAVDAVEARRWPAALEHAREHVLPARQAAREDEERQNAERRAQNPRARVNNHHRGFLERWWRLSYRRDDLLGQLEQLDRYIVLSRVAVEHRQSVYAFVDSSIRPGDALQAFAFDDEYSLGILHSTWHRLWFEERCSTMKVDLRYTSDRVFDSFPWPQAPTEETAAAVAEAMAKILHFREDQLESGLTLGELYGSLTDEGANPLRDLHAMLDAAAWTAYGFAAEDDPLGQLLALNLSIAEEEQAGTTTPRGPGAVGLPNTRQTDYRIVATEHL